MPSPWATACPWEGEGARLVAGLIGTYFRPLLIIRLLVGTLRLALCES